MKKDPGHNHKCQLCKRAIADKKNSHIIPSFIVCRIASADGSGKRAHELVYSFGQRIKAYVGNAVPVEIVERNFEDLSDERIEEELKINPLSKDFIFCSSCERSLGYVLESPFASKQNIKPEVAYFFWLSVLWRVNRFDAIKSKMPKFILSELRKNLDAYLQAKIGGISTSHIQQIYPFNYRILTCKDYSKDGEGFIYAEYDKANRVFYMTLGDSILCFDFNRNNETHNISFFGLEKEFNQAPLNNIYSEYKEMPVSNETFSEAYNKLIEKIKCPYINNEIKMISKFWEELEDKYYPMPSSAPSDIFIRRCLEIIHEEKKKIGERYTLENFARSFAQALSEIYDIRIE